LVTVVGLYTELFTGRFRPTQLIRQDILLADATE